MAPVNVGQLNTELDELMKFIPEDKREAARTHYSKVSDAARAVTDTATRVADTARKQSEWWETNKDAVTERDQLRADLERNRAAAPADVITKAVHEAELGKMRDEILGIGLGMVTELPDIALGHYREFNEQLNTRDLAQNAIAAGKTAKTYYDDLVRERREKKANEDRAAADAKLLEQGRVEGRKEILERAGQGGPPYPVGSTAPTTLTGLRKPAEGQASPFSLDAAVATANAVAAKQQGA